MIEQSSFSPTPRRGGLQSLAVGASLACHKLFGINVKEKKKGGSDNGNNTYNHDENSFKKNYNN